MIMILVQTTMIFPKIVETLMIFQITVQYIITVQIIVAAIISKTGIMTIKNLIIKEIKEDKIIKTTTGTIKGVIIDKICSLN